MAETQQWRWMEDECPFQLGDFFVKHFNFPGCIAICLDECILCFATPWGTRQASFGFGLSRTTTPTVETVEWDSGRSTTMKKSWVKSCNCWGSQLEVTWNWNALGILAHASEHGNDGTYKNPNHHLRRWWLMPWHVWCRAKDGPEMEMYGSFWKWGKWGIFQPAMLV